MAQQNAWLAFILQQAYHSHKSVQQSKSIHDTVTNSQSNKLLRELEEADVTVWSISMFLSLCLHIPNVILNTIARVSSIDHLHYSEQLINYERNFNVETSPDFMSMWWPAFFFIQIWNVILLVYQIRLGAHNASGIDHPGYLLASCLYKDGTSRYLPLIRC